MADSRCDVGMNFFSSVRSKKRRRTERRLILAFFGLLFVRYGHTLTTLSTDSIIPVIIFEIIHG